MDTEFILHTFLGVWLPNLQLLFTSIVLNIILNISRLNLGLLTFFTLCATAFILLYLFFPIMILTFVYPTWMIVIFAFVIAYLFATSIFSGSSTSTIKPVVEHTTVQTAALSASVLGAKNVTLFYLHFLMLFILYLFLVGRASVISTGPSVIISLFTPALVSSIGALVLKKTNLISEPEEKSCEGGTDKVKKSHVMETR